MDDENVSAIELKATAVANSPLLGYRLVEAARRGDGSACDVMRWLRLPQLWIETENSPITIDIEMFEDCCPLADLLGDDPGASRVHTSLSEALADFGSRWTISSQLHDRVSSSDNEVLSIAGRAVEALVWRDGMVVGAREPLATALRLLIAGFSEAARQRYVYSNPQLLACALALLPEDVTSRYVPEAAGFIAQAEREKVAEGHALAAKKRGVMKKWIRKITIKPTPDGGYRPPETAGRDGHRA